MRYLILFTFFICWGNAEAQRFGGNPLSTSWKKWEGNSVQLIFPTGYENQARQVADRIDRYERLDPYSLGQVKRKIPIVLQTLPLVSNAYVGLGPWRSEFYLNPLQNALDLGSTDWLDNLSYHEYRHVQQYSNFRKGLSSLAYAVAGEQGQALANAASVPDWFFEGDAVFIETHLLNQGRGRLPSFYDPMRALWAANKKYSYQKLRSGSLKDVVPNHYLLGYLLVEHGYKKYGDDFWKKVTDDASRFRGLIYPFQKSIQKHTGISFKSFVRESIHQRKSIDSFYNKNANELLLTKMNTRVLENYFYPNWIGMDSVLALKKANNQIPKWVIIHGDKEKSVAVKDLAIDDFYRYKNGMIVYTGYSPDARWQWKEFSDIYQLDLKSGLRKKITKGERLFSPDITMSGDRVVAVSVAPGGLSSLAFIELNSPDSIYRIYAPDSSFLSYPLYNSDDSHVYVVSRKSDGRTEILDLDLTTMKWEVVLNSISQPISYLSCKGESLFFSVTHQNRNEIWSLDLETKQLSKLVSAPLGSYAADWNSLNQQLVFSRPTAEGEQLYSTQINSSEGSNGSLDFVKEAIGDTTKVLVSDFTTQRYPALKSPFNIHSWRPFYEQPEWSFTLYGENVLNTVQTSIEYVYNENENSHRVGAGMVYGGLYPWLVGGVSYTMDRRFSDSTRTIRWNEGNWNVGLRLPLNFSGGRYYRNVELSTRFNGVSFDYATKNNVSPNDRSVYYIQNQLSASFQSQQAVQHIFPRFAYAMRLQQRVAVGATEARQILFSQQVYLPGAFRNHSLVAGFTWQSRDTLRQYIYGNGFPMARGYQTFDFPRMWRYSLNYHMPLVYPDFGVGNIVYFLRLRSNVFYDHMSLKSLRTKKITELRSAGVELYFDTKWWNQQKVSFGVRYSRLLDTKIFTSPPNPNRFEFIMPLNLLPG
jgi:hypothetical protein